jgi:Na+/proline symporter
MLLNSAVWIILFLGFTLAMIAIGLWVKSWGKLGIEGFLVSHRSVGLVIGAASVASSWIWAPALFVSAQVAFTNGYVQFCWFLIPNVIALILFAPYAQKLRNIIPMGFTLIDYMRTRYGNKVHNLYIVEVGVLQTCSFAVQLVAGGLLLNWLTGIPYWELTIFMAGMVLAYVLIGGMKVSVITDYLHMIILLGSAFIIVPWAIMASPHGFATLDWNGIKNVTGFFSTQGIAIALAFGISTSVGLLAGPFGDQSLWQRVFSVKINSVTKTFLAGAFVFLLAPLSIGLLGFLGAGMGIHPTDPQLINIQTIVKLLPVWVSVPFTLLLLAGLSSTLDSNLCSISSIASVDIVKRVTGKMFGDIETVKIARIAMVILAIIGVGIANIPAMTIITLFLFYGTIRATTFLPTFISINKKWVSRQGMFWGILFSMVVGAPLFAYGYYIVNVLKVQGSYLLAEASILTVVSSGIICLIITWYLSKKNGETTLDKRELTLDHVEAHLLGHDCEGK